jgi:hypothetical protein
METPGQEFQGDIRLTPFYNAADCCKVTMTHRADAHLLRRRGWQLAGTAHQ